MHSLVHLVDSNKCRGVTSNCSTDRGEALHPQNKKYWGRSNRQASAPVQVGYLYGNLSLGLIHIFVQMLHMATESEVIQKLRYQVDNYDEWQELLRDSEEVPRKSHSNPQHHAWLCSPETNCATINAYNITLQWEHGITDFLGSLSSFLKRNNLDSDVGSYKVGLNLKHFSSHAKQVRSHLITHVELSMTARRLDPNKWIFSVQQTPGKMKAHDMTMSLFRDSQGQVFSLPRCSASFQSPTPTIIYGLSILSPFTQKHRNKLTGFIELEEAAEGEYEFCFIDSLILTVNILPPTPTNKQSIVQDLVDGDTYLRLITMN